MVDLDEMKQQWAEYDKKLDESMRLNRQMLTTLNLKGVRSALERMTAFLALQAAVWFAIVVALGGFVYRNAGTPRFAIAGASVDLFAIGMLAGTIWQIAAAQRIDYGKPIAIIQKELAELRVWRIRLTQWALLAGTVVWAPCAVIAAKVFLEFDTFSAAWLWANVLFGLSLIPLAIWASKRFAERMGHSPFIQSLMRDIAGRNLNAAAAFLASLSQFESEN